jgi:hypothetical protein
MSYVTLRIKEAPGRTLVVEIDSHPPLPLDGGSLDFEAADRPQVAAFLAAQFIGALGEGTTETLTAESYEQAAARVKGRLGLS